MPTRKRNRKKKACPFPIRRCSPFARSLSGIKDDPIAVWSIAKEEFNKAEEAGREDRHDLRRRQAAEKAYLALVSAAAHAARQEFKGFVQEKKAVDRIASKMKDPGFSQEYRDLRQALHGNCFHRGVCGTTEALRENIGLVRVFIDRLLRYRSKGKRR